MMRLERLGKLKNPPHRDSIPDLPACSIVPQPTTLSRASNDDDDDDNNKYFAL
jgi:hypothetical protein